MSRDPLLDGNALSVVLLCWNHESFVEQCLRSVAEATTHGTQVIVIDNGSEDDSVRIIRQFIADLGLDWRVFANPVNLGIAMALNQGLDVASGRYFVALSTDDFVDGARFRLQVAALEAASDDVVLACGEMKYVDSEGNGGDSSYNWEPSDPQGYGHALARVHVIHGKFPSAPTVMFRSAALRSVGGFDTRFAYEDLPIQIKLSLLPNARFLFVPNAMTFYRVHSRSAARTGVTAPKQTLHIWRTLASECQFDTAERAAVEEMIRRIVDSHLFLVRVLRFASFGKQSRLALLRFALTCRRAPIGQRLRALLFAAVPVLGRCVASRRYLAELVERELERGFPPEMR